MDFKGFFFEGIYRYSIYGERRDLLNWIFYICVQKESYDPYIFYVHSFCHLYFL